MATQKIHKVIVTDLMKKKSYKRKRGPVQAKKVTYDGIKFASGLERYMYQALKKAKIKATYEGATFEIVEDAAANLDWFYHQCECDPQ